MSVDPEKINSSQEYGIELQKASTEQLEKISNNPESTAELSPRDSEARAEKARSEALETAISAEAGGKEKNLNSKSSKSRRGSSIHKKQLDDSYKQTMQYVQDELSTNSRAFSKIIHNKYVEKTSDIIGSTIARPNAMLAGAFMAFILTLVTYTVAKTIGYRLSGFETISAFIFGWIIGIVYDYLRVLFTGKKD